MSFSIKPSLHKPNLGLNLTLSLPATPVITTAEGKKALRVDFSEDDDFIDALIEGATMYIQKRINRALITQTVIAEWDSVGHEVRLPYAPVDSITSLVTVDDDGTETPLVEGTGYTFRNNKIKINTGVGLKVTYLAGYGATAADVPAPIKRIIERILISLYDRRDDEVMETNVDVLDFNSMAILENYINYQ